MSGITTGVGVFSGIDSKSLIDQLLAVEARPRAQAQNRIVQLRLQNTAYLDLNTKMNALKNAAATFRQSNTFKTKSAVTSDQAVVTATAGITAGTGTFQMIVDRLVSTQQSLSRGFSDADRASIGITSMTVESEQSRLDRDVALGDLRNGSGITRGRISITDSLNNTATIDLSRATTANEVLEAINSNGVARVSASIEGGRFVLRDASGGSFSVANVGTTNTASSLGISGSGTGGLLTGEVVYGLNSNTTLSSLNDGTGVNIRNSSGTANSSFSITVEEGGDQTTVQVNLSEVWENQGNPPQLVRIQGAVNTVGGVISRINEALTDAGFSSIAASIDSANGRLVLTDSTNTRTMTVADNGSTTARDLGLLSGGGASSIISGNRILAGMDTKLTRSLRGGAGIGGDGVVNFTTRSGNAFSVNLSNVTTIEDMLSAINTASGALGSGTRVTATLNSRGNGILITDNTTGSGNLIITGTTGNDTAANLGISTGAAGVASSTVTGGNLQAKYIDRGTLVSSLNGGRGIGTGKFRIYNSSAQAVEVDIGTDSQTLGDIIDEINSRPNVGVLARINANGDGLEIVENTGGAPGTAKIKIEDRSGSVARNLNIVGEASGTGASNTINGSFEKTITFAATDNLNEVVQKINAARAGVTASVIRDASGSTPFRISFTSSQSGAAGRKIIDTGAFDLGLTTLDVGRDSRVFFGSSDPARAIVAGGSTNTLEGVLPGVSLNLRGTSTSPVNLTVSSDTEAIEAAIGAFVETFNTAVDRITFQTRYDSGTQVSGPLIGDGTALEMKSALYRAVQGVGQGLSTRYTRLTDVGISVGNGGKMEFDSARFREKMEQDPEAVEALFTTRTVSSATEREVAPGITARDPRETITSLGVVGQLEELAKSYVDSVSGILTAKTKGIDSQVDLQNKRVTEMTERLNRRRATLERQFLAMERTIGQLQSQQSALGSIQRSG
jgi:flagellar hook-associated protein 2